MVRKNRFFFAFPRLGILSRIYLYISVEIITVKYYIKQHLLFNYYSLTEKRETRWSKSFTFFISDDDDDATFCATSASCNETYPNNTYF